MVLIAELPCRAKFAGFNQYANAHIFSLYKKQNQLVGKIVANNSNNGIRSYKEYTLVDVLDFNEVKFKYEFGKYNTVILGNLEFKYKLINEDTNQVEVETTIHGNDGDIFISIEVGTTTKNILTRLQHITKMMVQDEFTFSLLSKY